MKSKSLNPENADNQPGTGDIDDPLIFLGKLMKGQDPRELSQIYDLVMSINDFFGDSDIPKSEWKNVLDLVRSQYKHASVSLSESANAAKTMAEYLYAKRKSIDVSNGAGALGVSDSLTEEEIILFREKFNDEY